MSSEAPCASSAIVATSRCEYEGGNNCAQAILTAFRADERLVGLEHYLGSGFGGGMGNTGCLCGALGGATVVLGTYVDSLSLEPVASRILAEQLTAELTTRFKAHYQSTCCRVIKRHHTEGSNEWLTHCAGLVEQTAAITEELIGEHRAQVWGSTTGEAHHSGEARPVAVVRFAVRDVMNAARTVASGVIAGLGLGLALFALWPAASWLVPGAGALGALAGCARVWGGPSLRRTARGVLVLGPAGALVGIATIATRGLEPYAAELYRAGAGGGLAPALAPALVLALGLAGAAALVFTVVRSFEFVRTR